MRMVAGTDDQRGQHHLGINRGAAGMAVEPGKGLAKLARIKIGVDLSKQVPGDEIFQAKTVKQDYILLIYMVPERGIEPPTFSLRVSCSTD